MQIPDALYEQVERRAGARGATIEQEVAHVLEQVNAEEDDTRLATARARMVELFRTVKGFRQTPRVPREDLYERG